MKIRFLRAPQSHERGTDDTFAAGEVYDLPPASADRWIRRGAAAVVGDESPAVEESREAVDATAAPAKPKTSKARTRA